MMRLDLKIGDRVVVTGDASNTEGTVVSQEAWYSFFDESNRHQIALTNRAPDIGMVAVLWDESVLPFWVYDYDLTIIRRQE